MRISISNIAWDVSEDDAMVHLLHEHHIDAIDIAPAKYFPAPANVKEKDIIAVKNWWSDKGIDIIGMQALLFGTTGLNVFGDQSSQNNLLDHLTAVCHIGATLGATKLVFGSPKNRDRTGLTDAEANDIAVHFFSKLGEIANASGVVICLEPNPTCYGSNFMANSVDTLHVVQSVAHPAIRMQLDAGAMIINHEDIASVVAQSYPWSGHVHASEPDLMPLGEYGTQHEIFGMALAQHMPSAVVTIETLASRNEPHLSAITRSLNTAIQHYGHDKTGHTT